MNMEDNINEVCKCLGIEPNHIDMTKADKEYNEFIKQFKNGTYEIMGIPIRFIG